MDYEIGLRRSFRTGDRWSATVRKIYTVKRKSLVVAFATYSHSVWEVQVVQITKASIRTRIYRGYANPLPDYPRHLSLRQIRAKCVAETRELAKKCDAQFGGVRRLIFSDLAEGLAKKNNVPDWGLRDILERAQTALGGIHRAVKWLHSPCAELNGQLPMEMVRRQSGRGRLQSLLTRLQFKHLVKKGSRKS
jgi:hypothetical protein